MGGALELYRPGPETDRDAGTVVCLLPPRHRGINSTKHRHWWWFGLHADVLTLAELLAGASVDYPKTAGINRTFKQAPRQVNKKVTEQQQDEFGE